MGSGLRPPLNVAPPSRLKLGRTAGRRGIDGHALAPDRDVAVQQMREHRGSRDGGAELSLCGLLVEVRVREPGEAATDRSGEEERRVHVVVQPERRGLEDDLDPGVARAVTQERCVGDDVALNER
jgi:hypothetical protein